MKVLVTGSSGRLGRSLQRRLDRSQNYDSTYLISPRATAKDHREHPVDLRDRQSLRTVFHAARPDVVVHLASVTGRAFENDPTLAQEINAEAVRTLTELSNESGTTRLVFASSAAVYGDQGERPFRESAPIMPASVYGEIKWQGEQVLLGAEAPETVALRIFNIFGDEFEDSLVWRLLHSSAEAPVQLRGPHDFVRDYIHVDDVVDAILASLQAPLLRLHETVNIGTGIPTSNAELIDSLRRRAPIHFVDQGGSRSFSCADTRHASHVLGFVASRRP